MRNVLSKEQVQAFRLEIEYQLRVLRREAREVCGIERLPDESIAVTGLSVSRTNVRLLHLPSGEIRACLDALGRIGRGCFGLCAGCGEHIELNRLNADPLSLYCIRCHSAAGRKLKRAG